MTPNIKTCTIEVTTACNLRCTGCARTIGMSNNAWATRHMPVDLFASVITHLPPLQLLILHGIGEPTLHPDYPTLVATASRTGKFKTITANTNGLVHDVAYYRTLVEQGLNHLTVSVDSLTPTVAAHVRAGTDTNKLSTVLAELLTLPIQISVTTVASKLNLYDLPKTFEALNELGRLTVNIQPFIDLGDPVGCLTEAEITVLRDVIHAKQLRWPNLTLNLLLTLDTSPVLSPCPAPWQSVGVTVDGFLTPCCVMWDPDILGRANLGAQTIESVFATATYRDFIANYLEAAPAFCGGCPMNARPLATERHIDRHPAVVASSRRGI